MKKNSLNSVRRDRWIHYAGDILEIGGKRMNIGKFDVLVVVTQIVIDIALASLLALIIFR